MRSRLLRPCPVPGIILHCAKEWLRPNCSKLACLYALWSATFLLKLNVSVCVWFCGSVLVRPLLKRGKVSLKQRGYLIIMMQSPCTRHICAFLDLSGVLRAVKPPAQLSSDALVVGLLFLIFGWVDPYCCLLPRLISSYCPPTRVDHVAPCRAAGSFVWNEQFRWLAATTSISSALAAGFIIQVGRRAPHWDVVGIWGGITAMFALRFLATIWRVLDRNRGPYWVLRSYTDGGKKSS